MLLQKLLAVLDELESLKPKVRHQLDELEKARKATQVNQFHRTNHVSKGSLSYNNKQVSLGGY